MQAKQFGIKNGNQKQNAPKATKPVYKAIDSEKFAGNRQVYTDSNGHKGFFPVDTSMFVFITATRYHAIAGELFCGRQTYWNPAGEKGFFDAATNKFRSATVAEQLRLTGMFRRPFYIVETDRRLTGHQLSKGKKNGKKQKKAA